MKAFFALGFVFYCLGHSAAQREWVTGSVVLKDNRVLTGQISKKPIHELILLQNIEGVKALPAHQVAYYRFYDAKDNINRQFLSVKSADVFDTSKFFEIVIHGNAKVVRKYHKKSEFDELDEVSDFDYFAFVKSRLIPLSKFKKKILPILMEEHPREVQSFIEANNLADNTMKTALVIIKHFNTLGKREMLLAQME